MQNNNDQAPLAGSLLRSNPTLALLKRLPTDESRPPAIECKRRCFVPETDWQPRTVTEHGMCARCNADIKSALKKLPPVYWRIEPRNGCMFAPDKPFVTLLGKAGTRKTATAAHLLRQTAFERALMPRFCNCAEMFLDFREAIKRDEERKAIDAIAQAELLLLDDLGAERPTDYSISMLYLILNRRGEWARPTIVTCNASLDELSRSFDDRIAHRLKRYGEVYEL